MNKKDKLNELKALKISVQNLSDYLLDSNKKISDLLNITEVNEYEMLRKEREKNTFIYKEALEKIMNLEIELCNHNLFCFISEFTDSHEGRTYWTCKCIECGKVIENRNREFKDNEIIFPLHGSSSYKLYDEIVTDYHELNNTGQMNIEEIIIVLLQRYSKEQLLSRKKTLEKADNGNILNFDEMKLFVNKDK